MDRKDGTRTFIGSRRLKIVQKSKNYPRWSWMKLVLVLALCAVATAAFKLEKQDALMQTGELRVAEDRNILVNALVRQLIAYLRRVINNGSVIFGMPPLDPLVLEEYELNIPAGLINLQLKLKDVLVTGIGGFDVPVSNLNLNDMTFDLDIVFPHVDIKAGEYDLVGDLYNAIPLYGKGPAQFEVENFRLRGKLHLKQSDDGQSVLIDRIESPFFEIPSFKSNLAGVIGGGNIDAIVNAMVEEVFVGYINRFQGAISIVGSSLFIAVGNPILDQLESWKYIAPFVPRL